MAAPARSLTESSTATTPPPEPVTSQNSGPGQEALTESSHRPLVWWATLLVAGCAAVATAHGLYSVATECGVRPRMAGLYVPITDGLAMVAYLATAKLHDGDRRYAWTVVVLAAGLSGLAQAVNLAGLGAPDWRLRFGVGYWPALATALGLHLLWLVRETPRKPDSTVQQDPLPDPEQDSLSESTGQPAGLVLVPGETVRPDSEQDAPDQSGRTPSETPQDRPKRRRVSPANQPRTTARRTVTRTRLCESGCGKMVSRSVWFQHKAKGCPGMVAQ